MAWRVTAFGPHCNQDEIRSQVPPAGEAVTRRPVRFSGGVHGHAGHARSSLQAGKSLNGPAIIEERETTIVILPGWQARSIAMAASLPP